MKYQLVIVYRHNFFKVTLFYERRSSDPKFQANQNLLPQLMTYIIWFRPIHSLHLDI
jgi:hypothetical protein